MQIIKERKTSNLVKIAACFSVFTALYAAFMIGEIYNNKKTIEGIINRQINYASVNDQSFILQSILAKIEKENIPIKESDVEVEKDDHSVHIKVTYSDTFNYFEVPIKKYNFVIEKKTTLESGS
jgi:hypothetical protein